MLWKYPMRLNNPVCPQPPLKKGIYQFLREVGIIYGKGPNLKEEFGLSIQHTSEVFEERYVQALHEWFQKIEVSEGRSGPRKPMIEAPAEFMDDYDDDDDQSVDLKIDGRPLSQLPGGEDRRGSVSEITKKQWVDSYSSRWQRALDLSE